MADGELSGDGDHGKELQWVDSVVEDLSRVGAHVVDLGHEKGSFFFDC